MSRTKKVGVKSPPTRARAKKQGPVDVPRRRRGRPPLDLGRAAEALALGKDGAEVAVAAGSRARTRKALRDVGARIVKKLRENGQIQEAFERADYTLDLWARQVAEQATGAMKVSRQYYAGKKIHEAADIDWSARTAARQQYMHAMGLCRLEIEDDTGPGESPLGELTDEQLCELRRYAAEVAAKQAGNGGSECLAPAPKSNPC